MTAALVYLAAMMVAVAATPVTARIARAAGVIDMPGARKVHREPVPRIGGVVFVLAAGVVLIFVLLFDPAARAALEPIQRPMTTLLAAAMVVFLLGLMDDVRDISPKLKFLGLLAAAVAVCAAGGWVESLHLGGGWWIRLGWLGWPVTLVWIVGATVAMNFIDGLDGLAAGVAMIVSAAILLVALWTGQIVMAAAMLAMMGALTGFLIFNFNPAGIFMGDCGSMFLGFTLAAACALTASRSRSFAAMALPALAMGVPIFDAALTFIRRGVLERRSIFRAERGHIHHRLVDLGLPQRHAVLLLYAVSLGAAALGSFMMVTRGLNTLLVFCNVLLLLGVLFRGVGSLRVQKVVLAVRRNRRIHRRHDLQRRNFEDVQLMLRVARRFDAWWVDLCEAAARMNFVRMALTLYNRDGTVRCLNWRSDRPAGASAEMVLSVSIPIRQRRSGGPLRMRVDLAGDGSLESAAESLEYFSRLLDEHSLADLPPDQPGEESDSPQP